MRSESFHPPLVVLAVGCIAAAACGGGGAAGQPRSCVGVTCTNDGVCFEEGGWAWCSCPAGFHPDGTSCTADNVDLPCAGVTCYEHGWCRVGLTGAPRCECFAGYHLSAFTPLVCIPDAEPDGGDDDAVDVPPEAEAEAEGETEAEGESESESEADADADAEAEADGDAEVCQAQLGGECDPVQQCGCDATQRCVIVEGGPGGLLESCGGLGVLPAGSACTLPDDGCEAGAQCFAVFGRLACERFCDAASACAGGGSCKVGLVSGADYGLCTPTGTSCSPLDPATCPTDYAFLVIPGAELLTYCSPSGGLAEGASCLTGPCGAGLGCYAPSGGFDAVCLSYCDLATAGSCGASTCTDVLGNGAIGVCVT